MTTLVLNSYSPNFNDPRIRARLRVVLEWCDCLLGQKRPKTISSKTLRQVFGNTSQPFGRWLRSNLLMQVGSYQVGKRCYSYVLNESGYEKLCALADVPAHSESEAVTALFGSIISGDEAPIYRDDGRRRYHPVQNVRREVREAKFAGWWDYDIEACAPTLLYQYVVSGRGEGWGQQWLATIHRLAYDKDEMRAHVCLLTGLSLDVAKKILNALFFKAVVAPHNATTVFQLLQGDEERLVRLKSDPVIRTLRREVRYMWELAHIRFAGERARAFISSGRKPVPSKSRAEERSLVYQTLERRVINAMEIELPHEGCVLMHDGFMLTARADVARLEAAVLERTGFHVKLKESRYGFGEARGRDGL